MNDNIDYFTPVRKDVLKEIENRKKHHSNYVPVVGSGTCDYTLILKKDSLSQLSNPSFYLECLNEIKPRFDEEEQEGELIKDDIDKLFDSSNEEEKEEKEVEELEEKVQTLAKDSLQLNAHKRKKVDKQLLESLKVQKAKTLNSNTLNGTRHTIMEEWYQKCNTDLQKGYINSIPKMYQSDKKMPPFSEFVNNEIGDAIIKYNTFLVTRINY